MIRFKYPIGKLHVFANAGISNGFMLSGSDYSKHVYKYTYSGESVKESKPFPDGVRKYEVGFLGGLGIRYAKYALEARYEKTNGMLDYAVLWSKVTKVSFLLSYRLTK
jgi:hypothetical protein